MPSTPLFSEPLRERLGIVFSLDEGRALECSPMELLLGYTKLRAISFSASLKGLAELLAPLEEVELLLGLEEGHAAASALAALWEEAQSLLALMGTKRRLEVRFLPNSHAKLYLLEGPKGVRTILGSLNLSQSAWSGVQGEIAAFSDRLEVYQSFLSWYEGERERARPLLGEQERKRLEGKSLLLMPTALPPEEVRRAVAEAKGIVVVNLLPHKPLVDRTEREKEAELRALKELTREMRKAEDLVRLRGKETYLQSLVERALREVPVLEYAPDGPRYRGLLAKDLSPDPQGVEATLRALSALLEGARRGSPSLAEAVGEALVYGFASSYLPLLREEAGRQGRSPTRFPIVALLVGRAGAGKTTILRAIAATWGISFRHYRQVEETGRSKGATVEAHLYLEERAPLPIDEVPPRHLTEENRLAQVVKGVGDDPGVRRALILTSNLEHFRSEEQILRRAWFIPFEHLPQGMGSADLEDHLKAIRPDLFLRFLQEAFPTSDELASLLQGNDPLAPARRFLRGMGLSVPEGPKGDYRAHLLARWRNLYHTQREIFREIQAPDIATGRPIPCFVVDKEKAGFLVPLQAFDNGFSGNGQAFLLKKREFLEAIGEGRPWWRRVWG